MSRTRQTEQQKKGSQLPSNYVAPSVGKKACKKAK